MQSTGGDGESLKDFESDLKNNLYMLWNRLSSGGYMPPPVKRVEIGKVDGGIRKLGIPTEADRIAHQALQVTKQRCYKRAWVLDMDIKGLFDNIDHELLMKTVSCHVKEDWHLLYIQRWLTAPIQYRDGSLEVPQKGTPQGGVISPLVGKPVFTLCI